MVMEEKMETTPYPTHAWHALTPTSLAPRSLLPPARSPSLLPLLPSSLALSLARALPLTPASLPRPFLHPSVRPCPLALLGVSLHKKYLRSAPFDYFSRPSSPPSSSLRMSSSPASLSPLSPMLHSPLPSILPSLLHPFSHLISSLLFPLLLSSPLLSPPVLPP